MKVSASWRTHLYASLTTFISVVNLTKLYNDPGAVKTLSHFNYLIYMSFPVKHFHIVVTVAYHDRFHLVSHSTVPLRGASTKNLEKF